MAPPSAFPGALAAMWTCRAPRDRSLCYFGGVLSHRTLAPHCFAGLLFGDGHALLLPAIPPPPLDWPARAAAGLAAFGRAGWLVAIEAAWLGSKPVVRVVRQLVEGEGNLDAAREAFIRAWMEEPANQRPPAPPRQPRIARRSPSAKPIALPEPTGLPSFLCEPPTTARRRRTGSMQRRE